MSNVFEKFLKCNKHYLLSQIWSTDHLGFKNDEQDGQDQSIWKQDLVENLRVWVPIINIGQCECQFTN